MKRFLFNFLFFLLVAGLMGSLVIYGTSVVRTEQGVSLLQVVTGNPVKRGGQTFLKFYEAEHLKEPLDILVIGSSRAFRSFDPEYFEEKNINMHILATSSQAPLNTYYLVKKYVVKLKPKLVLFDVHLGLLNSNGLECLYDLCVNVPISNELFEMALAIDQPNAYSNCFSSLVNQLDTPIYHNYKYKTPKGYYKGFLRDFKADTSLVIKKGDTGVIRRKLSAQELTNLEYVQKIIRFIKKEKIPLVLTRQPVLSREPIQSERRIFNMASKNKVPYINLNKYRQQLDPKVHFFDKNHLNAHGARIISEKTLEELTRLGYKF